MILRQISILNYKNIGQADLELSPKMNCFIGQNGEGKTNFLDAIHFLALCKSSTTSVETEVLMVRDSVLFRASLMFCFRSRFG